MVVGLHVSTVFRLRKLRIVTVG